MLTRLSGHELDEQVVPLMRLTQKKLLGDPSQIALNSVHGLAYHRGLGNPISPMSSTPFKKYIGIERIVSFAMAAYSKQNIAVVANGASRADLSKWIGEFYNDTFTSNDQIPQHTSTKYHGGEERIGHDKGNTMILGFPGSSSFTSGSSYKPEIDVLTALLGGQSSIKWSSGFSLLSKATAKQSNMRVATEHLQYSDTGLLTVTLSGDAAHVADASRNVVDTLKRVAGGEVSAEDIKKATAFAKFRALETGEDVSTGLEATGSGLIRAGKAHQLDEIGRAIENVPVAKVKAVS